MDNITKTVLLVTCAFVIVACLIYFGTAWNNKQARDQAAFDDLINRGMAYGELAK